jgi:hypothetical protein
MIAIYPRFTKKQAKTAAPKIEKWFEENPKRRVCWTEVYGGRRIRRNHVLEDLMALVEE